MLLQKSIEFITADELASRRALLTLAELHDVVEAAWRDIRDGRAYGGKAVLSLPEEEFWSFPEVSSLREGFSDERLGWKLSSLYGVNSRHGAVKVIGANAYNRRLGLPRSTSTVLLLDKPTLRPIAILDGTGLSAARTGTYASHLLRQCFRGRGSARLFLFGAGPVARSVVECLTHSGASLINEIFVRSRTIESAGRFVAEMETRTSIPLCPVTDNLKLRDCEIVITASNARHPLFEDEELAPNAVSLHLGGDEVPERYIQRALRTGVVACDDIATVSRRNSQTLALYFSRKGLSLESVGPLLGIRELSSKEEWQADGTGPVCVTCVGLPVLDLYVAEATYEKYRLACEMGTASA